jgi:glycine betaine/choline ABC-type transport system substrate-binding protein
MVRAWLGLAAIVLATVVAFAGLFAAVDFVRERDDTIVVGSKNFSESWILAEIYAQRIEATTGLTVRRRHALGSTQICLEALRGGAIDLYPEYTGTGLSAILQAPMPAYADDVLPIVREAFASRWDLTWGEPMAFDNTYALAMARTRADALGIATISDLRTHPELRAGFATEFVARADGWPGLRAHYDLRFDDPVRAMEAGLMYEAAASGEVDVVSAYATDARVDKLDLVLLADDRAFFPPYRAAPLVRGTLWRTRPEIAQALAGLAGRLDDAQMRRLNARVDIEGVDPAVVAAEYLASVDLR